MAPALFDGWSGILRIVLVTPLAYISLVAMLRISGKRTLAKLNAFDLVVTIAIGSTLASMITSRSLPLIDGVAALALLIGLQWLAARAAVLWQPARRLIKSTPALLVRDGAMLHETMRRERIEPAEIEAAVRGAGAGTLAVVRLVILETDGSLSVVPCRSDTDSARRPGTSVDESGV